jgi:MarR family transcriptional regulator, organic hydroperoxide resistance regulator
MQLSQPAERDARRVPTNANALTARHTIPTSVPQRLESSLSRHTPLDLAEHLPYLINRVGSALVARFSADALASARLSIASWRVLAALANNGGLRQTDLAELTSIDASTLSRLITRLVRDGLVRRTRSKSDSREVAVALTPKARGLMARLVPVAVGLQREATRSLSKRDLATLKRVLRKMHDNLTRPTR